MPYHVSMMGWVGLGWVKTFVGWVGSRYFGLGFEKVTHDQLCSSTPFLAPPTCAHGGRQTVIKFCPVINLDDRKFFTDSTTPPSLATMFVTHMPTRHLFTVADFLVLF